ncbi:Siderophore iron transporter 1 [Paramyrothecium foliicola]|nr:Siderophore iron transporter 1 [Paramyrothecium foliicola]
MSSSSSALPAEARPLLGREESFSLPTTSRTTVDSRQVSSRERFFLFFSIFLVGCAYGLESQVRLTYQPYATASFNLHSSLSTINVLRSVIAVVAQPTVSKVADVFGRLEIIAICVVFYTVGILIEVTAGTVAAYYVGSIVYQTGYTGIILLMEVLIADYSSMRARVFFSYIPALPFLLSTWVSGTITSAVLRRSTWRLGLGMWAAIFPVSSLPLLVTLYCVERHPRAQEIENDGKNSLQKLGWRRSCRRLFHQIDVIGLVFLVAAFSLVLAPLTSAGGTISHWRDPTIVTTLAVGVCCIPAFIIWERRGARIPFVPFHLLVDRGVWAALGVRAFLNFAFAAQGTYLYTVLVVAFDFPIASATRIMTFFSFFGVFSGLAAGLVIYKIRRLKYVIVLGTILFSFAFVILIAHPGEASAAARSGVVSAQVLLGLASGLFAYPTQASIQASATKEHVATLTGLYLSFYNVGSALGTCLSGALWTQTLYPTLQHNLAFQPNATLARAIYDAPFAIIPDYPVGTEIRSAIIASYRDVQRSLSISGLCLCIPMIAFAFALRNPKLSERQIQPEAEPDET